jgi:hypothetical protein
MVSATKNHHHGGQDEALVEVFGKKPSKRARPFHDQSNEERQKTQELEYTFFLLLLLLTRSTSFMGQC